MGQGMVGYRQERNSKGVTTCKHAYDSWLMSHHLRPSLPTTQLKGFGPKLCERLTEQLKKHCEENGLPMPEHPSLSEAPTAVAGETRTPTKMVLRDPPRNPEKLRRTCQPIDQVPMLSFSACRRSARTRLSMTKVELIEEAQPHRLVLQRAERPEILYGMELHEDSGAKGDCLRTWTAAQEIRSHRRGLAGSETYSRTAGGDFNHRQIAPASAEVSAPFLAHLHSQPAKVIFR